MGLTGFQGDVVSSLNAQDARNEELLSQVVSAAEAVSGNENAADITTDSNKDGAKNVQDLVDGNVIGTKDVNNDGVKDTKDAVNQHGGIVFGGKAASLQGTGGVALLEYAKDAIQTAVSNISGMGTNQITARKLVERKMGQLG